MSLFAVSGGLAPTAVVMHETGPYARAFYDAMAHAHSFRLQTASTQEAQDLLQAGKIVAVVTIPADFDTRVQQNEPVQVSVQINNLNTDFTNDSRRERARPARPGHGLYPVPDGVDSSDCVDGGELIAIRGACGRRVGAGDN